MMIIISVLASFVKRIILDISLGIFACIISIDKESINVRKALIIIVLIYFIPLALHYIAQLQQPDFKLQNVIFSFFIGGVEIMAGYFIGSEIVKRKILKVPAKKA